MDCVNWKCSRQNKADAQKFVTNQRILLVVKQDIGGCDKKDRSNLFILRNGIFISGCGKCRGKTVKN